MKIELEREEIFACIMALERKKSVKVIGKWAESAWRKLIDNLNEESITATFKRVPAPSKSEEKVR